eukprot:768482-Hanusia_phi.AAC.4
MRWTPASDRDLEGPLGPHCTPCFLHQVPYPARVLKNPLPAMGAVESCCGKRRPPDAPAMPSKPISALGNQYVTFQPEQPELFVMRQRVWHSSQSYDVKDVAGNDWFKLEGKDAQWTGKKKLVLNTGAPHCEIEKKSQSVWHIYVSHERRVTLRRETSEDHTGCTEPRLIIGGDFSSCDYWFYEFRSRDQRRIARVERSVEGSASLPKDSYFVHVAASVDVALILLASMIVDACEQEEANHDGNDSMYSGRDSVFDSSRTGDDRWRHSLDPVPIQIKQQQMQGKADPNLSKVNIMRDIPFLLCCKGSAIVAQRQDSEGGCVTEDLTPETKSSSCLNILQQVSRKSLSLSLSFSVLNSIHAMPTSNKP